MRDSDSDSDSDSDRSTRPIAKRRLLTYAFVLLTASAVAIAGIATLTLVSLNKGTSSDVGAPQAVAVLALSGSVYNLAYDEPRDSLWWTYMTSDAPDFLIRYDINTGAVAQWQLPSTDHNGFLERVAVGPDGSIWLTEGYELGRLDPSLKTLTTIDLPLVDPTAAPGALDANALSPGTWPSALTFDDAGRTILGRHNVASLTVFDGTLTELRRIALPADMYGVSSIAQANSQLYTTSYNENRTVVLASDGAVIHDFATGFADLTTAGETAIAPLSGGLAFEVVPPRSNVVTGGPNDLVAANTDTVATYDSGTGSVQWFAVSALNTPTRVMSSPLTQVEVPNPRGNMVDAYVQTQFGAIALDRRGDTWIVNNTSQELLRVAK